MSAVTNTPAVSSTTSLSSGTGTSTSAKTIASNFNQFLSLLTTQLKNQNPLSPLDTNQFTQQLVQFSQVEQQLKTNDYLSTMASAAKANQVASAANYLGAEITADGSKTTLSGGEAAWSWKADRAASATLNIVDSSGSTVFTKKMALDAGPGSFTWDGRTDNGSLLSGGEYTIKIDAKDASNNTVNVTTEISGRVDAIDLTGSTPVLKIGSTAIPLDNVKSLRKSAA